MTPRIAAEPAANEAALQRGLTIDLRRTGRRGHQFWVSRRDRHLSSPINGGTEATVPRRGRHGAEASCSHGLPVPEVVDVARGEDAVHGRRGREAIMWLQDDVASI